MTRSLPTLRRSSPLRRVSKKRAKALREYSKRRKAFMEARPWCEVELATGNYTGINGHPAMATEVHHKNGRHGARLNDESRWLAVSRAGHDFIHNNPSEARARGWLV